MSTDLISPIIKEKAPLILAEIKKAKSILLHCHPSPDPDAVGSALAMKFVLEGMGKKVMVIKGDSDIPKAFMHFPGAEDIVKKNFFEVDLADFDLFIALDSGGTGQVSRLKPLSFPIAIRSVVIDHHASNPGFADVNLVSSDSPATGEILFDLFTLWDIPLNENIAKNLFIGIYTDTGSFKYASTTPHTFAIAAELVKLTPDFPELISGMENSNAPTFIAFEALALNSVETFCGGMIAMAIVTRAMLDEKKIPVEDIRPDVVVPLLRSVADWKIVATMTEFEPNKIRLNLRSKTEKYDVSKLAVALGGGGHKMSSGVRLFMSIPEAKALVVAKAKELYNL